MLPSITQYCELQKSIRIKKMLQLVCGWPYNLNYIQTKIIFTNFGFLNQLRNSSYSNKNQTNKSKQFLL